MDVATLLAYFFGAETAIREVAANPWSIGIGLVFVLTAGIARGYRKHDLRRRPGVLLLPLAASVVSSLALYVLVSAVMALGGGPLLDQSSGGSSFAGWLRGYGSFLGLFWMTAPLAWLYGVPYERWTDRQGAVRVRLGVLGLVSLWRMALMMRVLTVLLGCPAHAAFFIVMLFGDAVAIAALLATRPRPEEAPQLLTGMGAIGPTAPPETQTLQQVRGCVLALGIMTAPVWLLGSIAAIASAASWSVLPEVRFDAPRPTMDLMALAAGALVAWTLISIPAQRRQRLRTIETMLAGGGIDAGLAELSAHDPAEFPDHWRPPPAGNWFSESSRRNLLEIVEHLATAPSDWVRAAYLEQFEEYLGEAMWYWFDDEDFTRVARLLGELPEGPRLAARAADAIDQLFKEADLVSELSAFLSRHENRDDLPPFPVSDKEAGKEIYSTPGWPRDTPARRDALAAIRRLAGAATHGLGGL